MKDIDYEEIVSILWEVYKEKKSPLSKVDVDTCASLPSYNTCLRRGLSLSKLNAEFVKTTYYEDPKLCKCCGAVIQYEKKINEYCSHSCSATVSNTGRIRKRKEEDFDYSKARQKRYSIINRREW